MDEKEYWRDYEITRNDVYVASQSFYTYREIHNFAAEGESNYQRINEAAEFWNVTLYGLQTAFFIALGRLFDTDTRSHTLDKFLTATVAHPEFFLKEALAARRTSGAQKPEWLDDFLSEVWEPSASELDALKTALEPTKQSYQSIYQPIRHKVFAHRDFKSQAQTDELFSKTQIKEIDSILYSLHDVMEAVWQLFHNGVKPELGKRTFDYAERAKAMTRHVLDRLIGNG